MILRILSYNLHGGEGLDGKIDLPRLAKVISGAKPDLVALQEVDRNTWRSGRIDQPAEFAKLTGMQVAYGPAMDYDDGEFGNAILSRWPIQSSVRHALPSPAGREPRSAAEVVVRPDGGAPLRFLSAHFDHQIEDVRVGHAKAVLAATDGGEPAILAGDFNATPGSPTLKTLLTAWSDATAVPGMLTFPSNPGRIKIDYVLHRPAGVFKVVEARTLNEPVASDHCPVLVVLERV
jgi:endonuclease/exonuclease/phosphatase family metal-dependent hydrolase